MNEDLLSWLRNVCLLASAASGLAWYTGAQPAGAWAIVAVVTLVLGLLLEAARRHRAGQDGPRLDDIADIVDGFVDD